MALKGLKRRACNSDKVQSEKKTKVFCVNSFLYSLQQPECLTSLKSFVKLSKSYEADGDDVIKEYLECEAGLEEILKCVNVNEKKNLALATAAFSAVRVILMRILSDLPQYYIKAEVGCRYLLRAFLPIINTMLSLNSNAHQRKVVLRLLTGVAAISSELAHELAVQITLSPPVVELLVKHSQASEEKISVRSCFIHYLLSFFVCGSDFTIRLLLDKKGYINSIIPGLVHDSADTVVLVLATLRSKVLENPSISKTNKLRTFSVPIIRSLIGLYEWKGPKKWKGGADIPMQETDEEQGDKTLVCKSVHEFLTVLCTSRKHGIAFIDKTLGTSGNKQNPVLYGVIQGLEQPWDNAFTSELVVKMLQICPDLVKSTLAATESFLSPRASVKWEKTVSFVEKVITLVDPEHLKPFAESAHRSTFDNRLMNLVLSLTVPAIPLRIVAEAGVTHSHLAVRHRTVLLLVTLLLRLRQYQSKLLQWGVNLPADALSAYLLQHLPDAQLIHRTWGEENDNINGQDDRGDGLPLPDAGDYECALLQLLLLYQQMCPQLIDVAVMTQWIRSLLPNLLEFDPNKDFPLILARATWLSLSTDSSILKPASELFRRVALALFDLMGHGSKPARQALSALFEASGQLEGAQRELSIWFYSYTSLLPGNRPEVASFIVDTARQLAQNSENYLKMLQCAEEQASTFQAGVMHHFPVGSLQEVLDDLMEDNHAPACMLRLMENHESPSLLLVAALSTRQEDSDEDRVGTVSYFLSHVVVHLFHQQTTPALLASLVHMPHCRLPPAILSHIDSWFNSAVPHPLGKPFLPSCPLRKLSKKLLKIDTDIDEKPLVIADVFDSVEINDPKLIMSLFHQTLFYASQLTLRNTLTFVTYKKCTSALQLLMETGNKLKQPEDLSGFSAMDSVIFETGDADEEYTVEKCLQVALRNINVVEMFNPLCKDDQQSDKFMTDLICFLMTSANCFIKNKSNLNKILEPLKVKFQSEVLRQASCHRKWPLESTRDLSEILACFTLEHHEVASLLDAIALSSPRNLPGWQTLLEYLLRKAAMLKCGQVASSSIAAVADFLLNVPDATDTSGIQDGLRLLLSECPHLIGALPLSFFKFLLKQHSKDSATTLCVLLLRHNPDFLSTFRRIVLKKLNFLECASLVFSLLTCSSHVRNEMSEDEEFLRKLFDIYGPDIQKAIKKPSKAKSWMCTNVPAITLLLNKCFDLEMYLKILPAISENISQMTTVNQFYLNLIKAVFFSVSKNGNENSEHILSFVNLLLSLITRLSEEGKSAAAELLMLLGFLNECADNLKSLNEFKVLKGTQIWFSFCRVCLKYGLQNENEYHSMLLPLLTRFINGVYQENSNCPETVTLFQMTVSHSKFLNVVLGKTQAKGNLVSLLLILTTKAPSVMLPDHVPVLLGAYGATLSSTDQLILQLLQKYESSGVSLKICQPYLWGEAAVSHYSVRAQGSSSLWQQPHANQVLDMLDSARVQTTLSRFPSERNVQVLDNMQLDDPSVYDPAFVLPLMSKLLVPESPVRPQKVIHSGALALIFAALGSQYNTTRAAAWHVIGQLYTHLEVSRFGKEHHLWLHLLDVIRCGAADIVSSEKSNNESIAPRLSCIVSTFLARASLIISQPLHPLYLPLHNFILVKPSLNLLAVPEFLPLFHSSDLEHSTHRQWILEVIRDGLRHNQDIDLCFKSVLFKLLMDYYFSILADIETKILIVSVLESALKVPGASKLLINGYSIVVWLTAAVDRLASDEITLSRTLLSTIATLPVTLPSLPTLLMSFLTHLPVTTLDLCKYLEVLMSIKLNLLSRKHIDFLLSKAEEILSNVDDCKMLLHYEGKFYLQEDIRNVQHEQKAKLLLRSVILSWLKCYDK